MCRLPGHELHHPVDIPPQRNARSFDTRHGWVEIINGCKPGPEIPDMNFRSHQLPRLLVLAIPVFATAYILAIGPDTFYYESFGTLILSPLIYLRLLPSSLALPAGRFLLDHPAALHVLCGIPVAMLLASASLGICAFRKNSLLLSSIALLLTLTVFTTYHFLQPFGFAVLTIDALPDGVLP